MSAPAARPAISDPLRAGDPAGDERARARLRLAGAALFAAAGLTLGGVLLLPDPDPSDHDALLWLVAVCGALAALLFAWRQVPRAVLHLVCPLGSALAAIGILVAEPIGLTPAFVLWPLTVCAYFCGRVELAANMAFALAATAAALGVGVEPGMRASTFTAVVGITVVGAGMVALLRAEVHDLVRRLHALASTDPLTGALSRSAFDDRVAAELARSRRSGATCAMVVIDFDHFKRLNDGFGHAAGDDALRALAEVVDDERRSADVFGRVGGDEFAVLVLDTDVDGAARFAERVRERVALLATLRGWPTTLSAGVAGDVTTGEEMLRRADRALYAAKAAGRDRVLAAAGRPAPEAYR